MSISSFARSIVYFFRTNQQQQALMEALHRQDSLGMDSILRKNPRTTRRLPDSSMDPLCIAANKGNAEAVRALLPYSPINARNKWGRSALDIAASGGHLDIVNLLLSHPDVRVHTPGMQDKKTPLIWAAEAGNLGCVQALLPRSPVNARCAIGHNALTYAATNGHLDCVRALLPHCDANTCTEGAHHTALMLVAQTGPFDAPNPECFPAIAAALLPYSDACALDVDGHDAIDHALTHNNWAIADVILNALPPQIVQLRISADDLLRLPHQYARVERLRMDPLNLPQPTEIPNPTAQHTVRTGQHPPGLPLDRPTMTPLATTAPTNATPTTAQTPAKRSSRRL